MLSCVVFAVLFTAVPPYPWDIRLKTPSGRLKPWKVLNSVYIVLFPPHSPKPSSLLAL